MAQDDAERINGLMAAMGKKETENKALREQLAALTAQEAPDAGAGLAAEAPEDHGDPGWQPGDDLYVNDDGVIVKRDPPAPFNPNANNLVAQTGWTDRYGPLKETEPRTDTGWPT